MTEQGVDSKLSDLLSVLNAGYWEADLTGKSCFFSELLCKVMRLKSPYISFEDIYDYIHDDYIVLFTNLITSLFNDEIHELLFPPYYFKRYVATGLNGKVIKAGFIRREVTQEGNVKCFGYLQLIDNKDAENRVFMLEKKLNGLINQLNSLSFSLQDFLKFSDPDVVTETIMRKVLLHFDGSRVYIFRYNQDLTLQSCTNEVVAHQVTPELDWLQNIPTSDTPWLFSQLNSEIPVILNALDEIPSEGFVEKEILRTQDICSLMIAPMYSGNRLVGYMGIDIVCVYRTWSNEDYLWLSSLANIISICTELFNQKKQSDEDKIKAENHDRLKSAFLANMSHEIRTPLNSIIGFSELLAETEDPDEKKEYASIISNSNNLLLQLINDIIDLSKIESNTLDFIYSDVDINAMIKELGHDLKFRLKDKNIDVHIEPGLPECIVYTEKNRFTQVVVNLLNNAAKFTSQGHITIGYKQQGDMLRFYIKDTGVGLAEDKLSKLFGRFIKLNNSFQGSGLGLFISKTIVERLGGNIGAESEEGIGSHFWFEIPYTVSEAKAVIEEESPVTIKQDNLLACNSILLVAEDTLSNYKLFEAMLGKKYTLIHAWNGEEAIRLFKQEQPALILMDIKMPVLDGFAALKSIRDISPKIPVIAVTAYAFEENIKEIMQSGFNDYISKPILWTDLKEKIDKWINLRD